MPVSALAAPLKLALDRLKNGRHNDGLVVSFHIILRNFTVVPLLLFREKIHGIAFLQERVALVFLVFKHGEVAGLVAGVVDVRDAVALADVHAQIDELGKSGVADMPEKR